MTYGIIKLQIPPIYSEKEKHNMKKILACLMLVAMLASMLTVGSSAASLHADAGKTLNIAYGTATVDGKIKAITTMLTSRLT